ncbi:MAG TPA: acyltransferase [Xanthobacteraceae bacterium]|nr:acyltransferase [Xanthobacteraceae bacterium]
MLRLTSSRGNLASLDVLRGIAIISVLIAHFWPGGELPAPRSVIVLIAQFGVILFFFLSGFLMDLIYSSEQKLVPFIIRRSFRILPMYWLSILIIFATDRRWTLRDVVSNAFFATGPMHVTRMSGVYWTLYIEVLFYLTVPLVFFLGRRAIVFSPYVVLGLFGTLWLLGVRQSIAPHYLVYCYLGLQFGAWRRKIIGGRLLLTSVMAVVVVTTVLPLVSPFPEIVSPFLGAAPLVCAILLFVALRFPFRARPIEFMGDISYSLYLLHPIVYSQVGTIFLSYQHGGWIAAVASIGFSVALSAVTLVFIERPTITVGKGLIKRWQAWSTTLELS